MMFSRVLLFFVTAALLSHQPSAQSPARAVMLDLGAEVVVVLPDMEVKLPLTLNAQGEGPVQISMTASFPSELLKFVSVEPGSMIAAAKARFVAKEKAAQPGDMDSVITLDIESDGPLPAGTVGTFVFRGKPAAKAGTEIPVKIASRTAKAAGGQALDVRGADGLITLIEPAAPCFFYMH